MAGMSRDQRPVIVAFDGSDDAVRALHWAVDVAERERRPLEVVVVTLLPDDVAPLLRDYEAEFAQSADAMARDIVRHSRVHDPVVRVRHGWVLQILIEEAAGAHLMVVGSSGHGVVERHWLGSVSHHLAGHAPCDVAVVRAAHDPRATQILVGIDGSPASSRALDHACARAARTGESVLAVHAYQHPAFGASGLAVLPENLRTADAEAAQADAEGYVADVASRYPEVELRATAVVGRPARVLARLSDDASLVVVGTRGRNAFANLVLGSVAQETLLRAECPVVVVR